MATQTHQVWIGCDPDDVFDVLMNPAANRCWQTGVVRTRATATGLAEVGTTITEDREFAGCRATIVYRLVELDWGRTAVVRIIDGPLRGTASYLCREVDGGTELTVTSDVAPQGRWRLAARAIGGVLTAELMVSCQRLKTMLEQPANVAGTPRLVPRELSPSY